MFVFTKHFEGKHNEIDWFNWIQTMSSYTFPIPNHSLAIVTWIGHEYSEVNSCHDNLAGNILQTQLEVLCYAPTKAGICLKK